MRGHTERWPGTKSHEFWTSAAEFMEDKGYLFEAEYISAVLGWRQACDMRGLSQLQRCQMLHFVLKELMPWATDSYDFSHLEVNRFEVYYSVVYNVVCCNNYIGVYHQFVERLLQQILRHDSLGPEHPRSSTSDDVFQCNERHGWHELHSKTSSVSVENSLY